MTEKTTPPTDEQIIQAFRDYIGEKADANNQWAQSATDVTFIDGRVTITLDPERSGAEHSALLAPDMADPIDSFTNPVAFHDSNSRWLRKRVDRLVVKDIDGRLLGEIVTRELAERNSEDAWRRYM